MIVYVKRYYFSFENFNMKVSFQIKENSREEKEDPIRKRENS